MRFSVVENIHKMFNNNSRHSFHRPRCYSIMQCGSWYRNSRKPIPCVTLPDPEGHQYWQRRNCWISQTACSKDWRSPQEIIPAGWCLIWHGPYSFKKNAYTHTLFFFGGARQHKCPSFLCTSTLGLLCNPKYSIQQPFSSPVPLIKRQRSLTKAVLLVRQMDFQRHNTAYGPTPYSGR
jgi:hypothetical protein